MKSDFKTKLIQHILNKKNGEKGFTLIELLVVIIIIGILAAIALPSFLNQANKARESEAKAYVGSINRAQQAYYLEKTAFATAISPLGLGISAGTTNYNYAIPTATTSQTVSTGNPVGPSTRAFSGFVWLGTSGTESTTLAVLCQTITPTSTASLAGTTLTGATGATLPAAVCTAAGGTGAMENIK